MTPALRSHLGWWAVVLLNFGVVAITAWLLALLLLSYGSIEHLQHVDERPVALAMPHSIGATPPLQHAQLGEPVGLDSIDRQQFAATPSSTTSGFARGQLAITHPSLPWSAQPGPEPFRALLDPSDVRRNRDRVGPGGGTFLTAKFGSEGAVAAETLAQQSPSLSRYGFASGAIESENPPT